MPNSALDDLGFGDPNAPTGAPVSAPNGADISGGYHISKPPPPLPNEPDASLLARVGIAEGGPSVEGQTAVIRAMLERQAMSGRSIAQLIQDPGQVEAYWRGGVQSVDPSSAAYQRALGIAQTATPSPGLDSWGNPAVIKQRGWGKLPFDPSTGTMIGGQLFGKGYTPPEGGKSGSALDDLGFGENAPPAGGSPSAGLLPSGPLAVKGVAADVAKTVGAPLASAPQPASPLADRIAADIGRAKLAAAQADPHATWPFYDEANDVWRNRDGSIEQIGGAPQPQTIGPNGEIQVTANAGAASFSPRAINDWVAAHPLDPASQSGQVGASPQQSSLGRAGVGAEQGLSNVRTSVEEAQTSPIGNLLLGNPDMAAWERADEARNLLNRNANEINLGGSTAYQLGKFGGEAAGTLPAVIGTEGLLGAGAGALGLEGAGAASAAPWYVRAPVWAAQSAGRGALFGGEAAGLTSAGSDAPLGKQIAQGATTGAVLNPAFEGAGAVGNALWRTGAAGLAPLTESGRGKIIDSNLLQGTGGPVSGDFTEYVPGVQPTLAEATHSPVLAATERTLRSSSDPGTVNAFAARDNANAAARENFVDGLTSDPQTVEHMKAARDNATSQLRDAAFANKTATDASPVVQTIDSILASPAGQRDAVQRALGSVRSKLVENVDLGGGKSVAQVESDPEQLYGIRQAINDQLSPLAARTGSDAQLASKELLQVKNSLDGAIEQGAPGFGDYLKTYNQASKPIDALEYLQSLNLRNQRNEITLGQVNRAVRGMEADRNAPGVNAAKSLSDDQVQALYNLRSDLQRSDLTTPLAQAGRTKVVTGNVDNQGLVNKLLSPVTTPIVGALTGHPVGAAAVTLAKAAADTQKSKLQGMLVNRLLNPELTGAPLAVPASLAPRPRNIRISPLLTGLAVERPNQSGLAPAR